jgi:hypothetical protein
LEREHSHRGDRVKEIWRIDFAAPSKLENSFAGAGRGAVRMTPRVCGEAGLSTRLAAAFRKALTARGPGAGALRARFCSWSGSMAPVCGA